MNHLFVFIKLRFVHLKFHVTNLVIDKNVLLCAVKECPYNQQKIIQYLNFLGKQLSSIDIRIFFLLVKELLYLWSI